MDDSPPIPDPLPRVYSTRARRMARPRWPVPRLPTAGGLAKWLGLRVAELDWFADIQGRAADQPPGPLRHYHSCLIPKRGGKYRLIESPKARLKAVQRRILAEILDYIPPHDSAHGFRRGRSIVSFAAPHAARRIVLHLDLCDFFPSVPAARVHALFRVAGYPLRVARLLTGLCTTVTPADAFPEDFGATAAGWKLRQRFSGRHLPQGAPTSPSLANLCAFHLDVRLARLAASLGAVFTRYADDLAFSGDESFERGIKRFHVQACCIALEEGFEVRTRKTRFMRQGVRQQLAGVVVNVHPNVCRSEVDRLKAILTNCARHGPAGQNRDGHPDFRAHLLGKVAHTAMLNPERGRKLRALFDLISWDER